MSEAVDARTLGRYLAKHVLTEHGDAIKQWEPLLQDLITRVVREAEPDSQVPILMALAAVLFRTAIDQPNSASTLTMPDRITVWLHAMTQICATMDSAERTRHDG